MRAGSGSIVPMPTYEYRCSSCGHRLEVVQRISDDPLTTCEECGGALRRVFHPVGVVLKGSGFYATDNRSGKSLSPGEKKGDSGSSSESGSGSGSASGSGSSESPKPAAPSTSSSEA